ncbi:MAG: hypothetical protein II973_07805 [Spirochaetaceae bacterium]|nr:hypothetical protein [Spirochaetaceae bacterium]
MNGKQWKIFDGFRQEFKAQIELWQAELEKAGALDLLIKLQKDSQKAGHTPEYAVETPIVYNTALDKITQEDQIKLIAVGDNPGKNEQLAANRAYLVGQAGKLGVKFFSDSPELGIDFRKNVIILNKTPLHSPKTKDLAYIINEAKKTPQGEAICRVLRESQVWMAQKTAELHQSLFEAAQTEDEKPQLWLIGYGELKKAGVFEAYKQTLCNKYAEFCTNNSSASTNDSGNGISRTDSFLVFQHFSMNRFSIDLKQFQAENQSLSLKSALAALGKKHRKEIFGF